MSDLLAKQSEIGLHHQFKDLDQQHQAATQGMWVFLATEVLFFGGMFLAYALYRRTYPGDFTTLSQQLNWIFGTVNTAILLTSSFTMALAVLSAKQRRKQRLITYLSVTFILGAAFLTIKGFEYLEDFRKNLVFGASFPFHGAQGEHMRIFLFLYYLMTGVHALHLLIGLGLITVMIKKTKDNQFSSRYSTPIEVVGLYWHFVDIIWIFLYPLLYLVGKPVL